MKKTESRKPAPLDQSTAREVFRAMLMARTLDDEEIRLKKQGKAHFAIAGAGHEAIGAAFAAQLRAGSDWALPYYRDRAFCLMLGMTAKEQMLASVGSPQDPNSAGRQMTSHWGSRNLNIVSHSSPTATQFNQAVGIAEAAEYARAKGIDPVPETGEVIYVSSGEGATSQGEFWEALNVAANKKLPILFVIQDNEYAISVPIEVTTAGGNIAKCFKSLPGLKTMDCDGCDLLEAWNTARMAVQHARNGKGPVLVRARVTRPMSHSLSDDQKSYRTEAERQAELERDCMTISAASLQSAELLDESEVETLRNAVLEEARDACQEALKAIQWQPEEVLDHLYAEPDPSIGAVAGPEETAASGETLTMARAINRSLAQEMERDERILLFGQDVADASREEALAECPGKGGVFKITAGLQTRFGSERVYNTMLAEASIIGRAIGLALRGLRPIPEIQFIDFIWFAFTQIRSELATMRYRTAGQWAAPVIIRTPVGGYLRGGAIFHSQSPESIFAACPGIKIAYPSSAADAMGLLRAAVRMEDPILFMEHKHLYYQGYASSPDPGPDHIIPFGSAAVLREGSDATIITWGAMVNMSMQAAERVGREMGVDIEVIDIRTIVPLDSQTIKQSVRKTGRLLVVSEEIRTASFGAEIASQVVEDCFEWLDAPVRRVSAKDVWVAYNPTLEAAALPSQQEIEEQLKALMSY